MPGRRAARNGGKGKEGVAPSLMEQLLSEAPDYAERMRRGVLLKYGDVIEGVIMQRDRDEFLVEIGASSEGIVPRKEYSSLTAEEVASLLPGERILVFVLQPENADGHTVVSIDKARQGPG